MMHVSGTPEEADPSSHAAERIKYSSDEEAEEEMGCSSLGGVVTHDDC